MPVKIQPPFYPIIYVRGGGPQSLDSLTAMAKRAAQIAEFTIKGEIDEEQRKFFLEDLARNAKTFAKTVIALAAITIEKLWNAVVAVIWGAINSVVDTAIGALPLPTFPVGD